jgi:putative ABC transport system substrate-binding protein
MQKLVVNGIILTVLLVSSGLLSSGAGAAERDRPFRIGALTESWGPTPSIVGLRDGLHKLGYREDKDFFLGVRFTQGNLDALPAAARELTQHGVDLIFTVGVGATKAAQGATQQIPIVFTDVDDPVEFGLVKSYAQPGENMTGVTDLILQLGPKRLELFHELLPGLQYVLFPYNVTDAASIRELQLYRQAAPHLNIEVVELAMRTQAEAQETLTQSQNKKVQGILCPRALYLNIPGFVLQTSSEQAIATMFADAFYVERGGLASYGPNLYESGQMAARLVDKILKGAKPSEIPVEVNNKIEFVINLKVANKLGLTIPPEVLYQADRLIR